MSECVRAISANSRIPDSVLAAYEQVTSRCRVSPLSGGLINDTYRVDGGEVAWVLQRINSEVFPDPSRVMANLRQLENHVMLQSTRTPGLSLPVIRKTLSGADFMTDDNGVLWRGLSLIPDARNLSRISHREEAVEIGRTLGWFHQLTETLDVGLLSDTLPGFHVAPGYLADLDRWIERSPRISLVSADLLQFIDQRRDRIGILESARSTGKLRLRVMHGDPKLDNVLFSTSETRAVSIVDLDTVKPGLIHYDLGDCFRSSCNVSRGGGICAQFDAQIFEAVLEGYLMEAGSSLTAFDMEYLYPAIWLLPFELGIRFLSDHLAGDRYFKVGAPGENLERALRQFALLEDIESQRGDLEASIAKARAQFKVG